MKKTLKKQFDHFNQKYHLKAALQETSPVMFGYIPLAIAFGLLFSELELHWLWAVLMSLFVYAGAAQFLAVPLLLEQASVWDIALVTFLLNLRHIFYGLAFVTRFEKINFFKKNYMIFGLTDEAYSILTTSKNVNHENFVFSAIFLCQFYWVLGTAIGAYLGHLIHYDLSFLSFSLIALFIILTIEQAKQVKSVKPFIIAALGCVIAMFIFPQYMLVMALLFCVTYLGVEYKYAKS